MALIEREAAIAELIKTAEKYDMLDECTALSLRTAAHRISKIPEQETAPVVHGRVLDSGNPICGPCSVCGESTNRRAHYCSMCGARTDGGEGDG